MELSTSSARVIAAFLVAPLLSCLLAGYTAGDVLMAIVFVPFSYALIAPSIPIYFLFRYFNWLRLWQVVLAGALLAAAISSTGFFGELTWQTMLLLLGHGALTAFVFWLVAFAGARSNNSFKPNSLRESA